VKVAYISGPYSAATEWGVLQNIRRAEAVALEYWRRGYAVICPHKNSAFFGGAAPPDVWLKGDLEILRRLRPGQDVVVMVPGWESSEGALEERAEAYRLGLDIVEYRADVEA